MDGNGEQGRPLLWILDSERGPLADCRDVFAAWADCLYFPAGQDAPDWKQAPDAVFFSAEIEGGATGAAFSSLVREANAVPLLAVAALRSLAQAVAFFRAGAADYLSLPLEEEEVRERLVACMERAARLAVRDMVIEIERTDAEADPGGFVPASDFHAPASIPDDRQDEDILARLPGKEPCFASAGAEAGPTESGDVPVPAAENDEPIAVDGLPIPSLWEELPCGLLVFDSLLNLVFSNHLGLHLFGHESLASLQDALENRPGSFLAHAANHKPLADNQWPHILALKTHTARAAVLSLEKPDRRRVWLRIDCMPHLTDGKVSRLSMTLVNLTGELPPLAAAKPSPPPAPARNRHKQRGGKKGS